MKTTDIAGEVLRVLDQGATAVAAVVEAYAAQRSPERDVNWLAVQAGKEFGAITLQHERARDAIRTGRPEKVPMWARAMEEENEHYLGYLGLLEDTAGVAPVEGMYQYFALKVRNGRYSIDPLMEAVRDRWPDNHRYFAENAHYINTWDSWASRLVGAQVEGAGVAWHWAMSLLPQVDDFARREAEMEEAIVSDELHHGPEEIADLAAHYDAGAGIDFDEVLRVLRHLRCLEVRQRNEQYLHPLGEADLQGLERELMADTIAPATLFSAALAG